VANDNPARRHSPISFSQLGMVQANIARIGNYGATIKNWCKQQFGRQSVAMGQKRRFRPQPAMSVVTPKATAIATSETVATIQRFQFSRFRRLV